MTYSHCPTQELPTHEEAGYNKQINKSGSNTSQEATKIYSTVSKCGIAMRIV